jgi:class 3 adenylate cyclase
VSELPSGTVTFLFTDLVGSNRLWEEYPDAMQLALARHDEIVGGAIVSRGGHVVKTTGDGFLAANSSPQRNNHDAAAASWAKAWGSAMSPRLNVRSRGPSKSGMTTTYLSEVRRQPCSKMMAWPTLGAVFRAGLQADTRGWDAW